MTSDEIKQQYTMRDIAARYGLVPNRAGFIRCPFHEGDRKASLKLYEHDFHCFGCGANGDIFEFVQRMDNLTFREAFELLGGTYTDTDKTSFSSRLAKYRAQKARETRANITKMENERRKALFDRISRLQSRVDESIPLSQEWTDAYNALQLEMYHLDQLIEEGRYDSNEPINLRQHPVR